MRTSLRSLIVLVAVVTVAAGCGTGEPLAEKATGTQTDEVGNIGGTGGGAGDEFGGDFGEYEATLEVDHQTSDGTSITVAKADVDPPQGWVVIYTSESGAPAEVVGKHEVEGLRTDFEVVLDEPLDAGEHTLWAQMHVDAEPVANFQFPGEDVPITNEHGDVIHVEFTLTVEG